MAVGWIQKAKKKGKLKIRRSMTEETCSVAASDKGSCYQEQLSDPSDQEESMFVLFVTIPVTMWSAIWMILLACQVLPRVALAMIFAAFFD